MKRLIIWSLKKIVKNEQGIALPMALVLLLLGGLLLVPVLSLTITNLKTDIATEQGDKRVYAADAGIQWALWNFKYNTSYTPPEAGVLTPLVFSDPNFIDETVAVTILNEPSLGYRITSTATNEGGVNTITAYISDNGTSSSGLSPFKYAVATLGGDLVMTGSSGVTSDVGTEGDVYITGNINLDWTPHIHGDANVTGTVNRPGNVDGTLTTGVDPLPRPTWMDDRANAYKNSTNITMPSCSGSTTWTDSPGTYGALNIPGNMTISGQGTYTFTGPVCVGGNLTISSGVNNVVFQNTVKVTGYASLIGNGSAEFQNTVYIEKYLSISNSRSAKFDGQVKVNGAATTGGYTVKIGGSKYSGVTYDIMFNNTLRATGNMEFGSGRAYVFNNIIYATGNLVLDGNAGNYTAGQAMIADGNISCSNSSQVYASSVNNMPFLISTNGNITVSGSSPAMAIFYAPVGNVTVNGSGAVTGSIVARSVNLSGTARATFPIALASRPDIQDGGGSSSAGTFALRSYSIQ